MIFIAGISIALFIAALLLVKKNKSKADKFLILWMILNAIHLTFFYLLFTEEIYNYPYLLGWKFPLPLLHGVFLYYYVSSVTHQFPRNKLLALSHLTPALLTLIYLIPFMLLPAEQKIDVFKNEGKGYEVFLQVILIATFLSGIVYVTWSSLVLRKHKKRIREEFSDIEEITLKWLQFLTYGLGVLWFIIIFTQNDTLIFMGVSIFVILIGFFGIQQKNIFTTEQVQFINSAKDKRLETEKVIHEKYASSGLSDERANQYYEALNKKMEKEKTYINAELSLSELASDLGISPNYLSQIINNIEGKTFYDFINGHRIEEFKHQITLPVNAQYTLMAVAYDCGFNSKSSFNRYFKKMTGQTPSQFVKEIRN